MASDVMNNLSQFEKFDCEAFFRDKALEVEACEPLSEYEDGKATGRVLGTKVTVVIVGDRTEYKAYGDRRPRTNRHRMFDVKLMGKMGVDIPEGTKVTLVNPSGQMWGDRDENGRVRVRNKLSVTADDVRPVAASSHAPLPGAAASAMQDQRREKSLDKSLKRG